jgi:dihydrofolate synthase/folylpolyglutamate synthase
MSIAVHPAETGPEVESEDAYGRAVARLYALGQELAPLPPLPDGTPAPRRKWDLAHMRTLCAALGEPQKGFPAVLIAGTNGKGSTAATLASILAEAGYRTGLYTSPHLVRVNERVQILAAPADTPGGTAQIPDGDFARLYTRVEETAAGLVSAGELPHSPSFFEMLTALAFLYFAEAKVEIAVLEVGLGGRLDATNIVEPVVSVITDIALDHQEYLGDTIAAITREKAGILRPKGILVTLPQHPEANQAIGEAAATLDLTAISAAEFIPSQTPTSSLPPMRYNRMSGALGSAVYEPVPRNTYRVTVDGEELLVDSPLAGHHQQRNIALAIGAAAALRRFAGFDIAGSAMEAGIRETRWPGRLEALPPNLLLDVAHNPAGAWALRAAIAQLPEERPRTLIFSCLGDKDLREISRILFPLFDSSPEGDRPHDHIVLAPIANPRAAKVEDLLAAAHALDIPAHAAPHLAAAFAQARAMTPPDGLILATGSVYLVGAVRELAMQELAAGLAGAPAAFVPETPGSGPAA